MKQRKIILSFCAFFTLTFTFSQRVITINHFFNELSSSLDSKKNGKQKEIDNNTYELFKRSFYPSFSLNFSLPNYNRSISQIALPDGTFAFRESNRASSNIRFSVSQLIPYTGGTITLSNSLNRLDVFSNLSKSTSYSANWLNININQPLNFFNAFKWDRKIQENKLSYSRIISKQNEIKIKEKVINLYFNLLKIKTEKKMLDKELNSTLNLELAINKQIKYNFKSSLDSIEIKLRLNYLKEKMFDIKEREKLMLNSINIFFKNSGLQLNSFDSITIPIVERKEFNQDKLIRDYLVNFDILNKNHLLPFQKKIKQIESERHFRANFSASFGLNNSTKEIHNIFQNPNESQSISITLDVPVLDFNKMKKQIEIYRDQIQIAKIDLNLQKISTIESIKDLCRNIKFLYKSYLLLKERETFLRIKINHQKKLYLNEKILLNSFLKTNTEYFESKRNTIILIQKLYNDLLKLEKITLKKV